jgi:predicted nucleic acid-binding protein
VVTWIADQVETSCYISALTIGELTRGIHRLPVSAKRKKLEDWMQTDLLLRFKGRIISIDEAVASRWGILVAETNARGRVLPTIDSLLAATAQEYSLTLVTRNMKDFHDLNLKMLNPWIG